MGEPTNELEIRADHALDVFEAEVEMLGDGVHVEQVLLLARVNGYEPSGVVASHGQDDPQEVFKFLLTAATGVGQALGFEINLIDTTQN
jgi:hypothetical protein